MLSSQEITLFCAIADSESLAMAARKLGVTPSAITQRLQGIEAKLHLQLIHRNTKGLSLTDDGELLAQRGRQLLMDLEQLNNEILHNKRELKGQLSVLAPLGFGARYIAPLIPQFKAKFPAIDIDITLSDSPRLSPKDHSTVTIYIGDLPDSPLHCIPLLPNRRMLCAAPRYIERMGQPQTPEDLQNHHCLALRENHEDVTLWRFEHRHQQSRHPIRIKPYLSCNEGASIKQWALEGHGIIQRSQWHIRKEIENGQLIELLPHYALPDADIVLLVATASQIRPLKVQYFIDFLRENLSAQ